MGKMRVIKGFPCYMIDCVGNVFSTYSNKIIKPHYTNKGHLRIALRKNKQPIKHSIHRLVALEFLPNLENKPCINHKNGIKDDNRVENLEWCTYSENTQHAYDTGLMKKEGKQVIMSNETTDLFIFESQSEAGRAIGTSQGNIGACCRGERNYACGFKWRFF